uniref:Uncharacterized protein n=1 Tax=virus sp. ctML55 TaxID=2827627 RepID=A0A8S5RJE6_9VIRU|nr:MAG TPA: hypothetical protein [virus sp. ctML55]DAW92009.1 MAG TPA: hypothetical protein [Bacteriophage sp.]
MLSYYIRVSYSLLNISNCISSFYTVKSFPKYSSY